MTRQCTDHGWFWVPHEMVNEPLVDLRASLTFMPRFAEDGDEPVRMYRDLPDKQLIGVPRQFGRSRWGGLAVNDLTAIGEAIEVPRLPSPDHPRVKDPARQQQFMTDLHQGIYRHGGNFIATAPTGSGKTVCALHTIGRYGKKAIVLVHLERLMDQWIEEAQTHLGLPRERIGIVQQDRCEWQGKDIVIAMMHSLSRRRYPKEFYKSFGILIADEVHKVGSRFFSATVPQFPAKVRIGLSATPKREDGGDRVFQWHIGATRVSSDAVALPMVVEVHPHRTNRRLWGTSHGARIKCISQDHARNELIARQIVRLYHDKRQILVVAEGIEHLQTLMGLVRLKGIPRTVIGQFTNKRFVYETVITNGKRERKKIKSIKSKPTYLADVQKNATIIFATYGMITEGIDIPRLDGGIDATPRAKATQLIGRIRRPMPGKRTPIWITVLDVACPVSQRYYMKRLKDYEATGAEVITYAHT